MHPLSHMTSQFFIVALIGFTVYTIYQVGVFLGGHLGDSYINHADHINRVKMRTQRRKSQKSERILVLVMGPAEELLPWVEYLDAIEDDIFHLLYASFDLPPDQTQCAFRYPKTLNCDTMFIPKTTWTQGRNLLAKKAIEIERLRGIKFDWWLFLDDDVEFTCRPNSKILGASNACFGKILTFMNNQSIPEGITTIGGNPGGYLDEFTAVSTADAYVAGFRRKYIPFLLPYALPIEGTSEWLSQAVNFCVMQSCFPSSLLLLPDVVVGNAEHRPYTRGISDETVHQTIAYNFCMESGACPCAGQHTWDQGMDRVEAKSLSDLGEHIPKPTNSPFCRSLEHRFHEWMGNGNFQV